MLDWYPSQEPKLQAFLANYIAYIDGATTTLGLPAPFFADSKQNAQAWLDAKKERDDAEKVYLEKLKTFQEQNPLTDRAVRAAVKQIKSSLNVTPGILTDLELDTQVDAVRTRVAAQQPVLKLSEQLGRVTIKYTKHGHQALDLYCCRTGEDEFTLLGRYSLNTIEDARPNRDGNASEVRQYYGIFVDKDQQVSARSSTASLPVGSQPS
ncbi:MAG: hypothetical protein EOO59_17780 [Hymenobacter sp.]|nr:MAG: hypothetical protein EOO59_17780 [Hymenobacter sp.]